MSTEFDGERAFEHVRKLVEMGPRAPGTRGHDQTVAYIEAGLRDLGLTPIKHLFVATTPDGPMPLTNILAVVPASEGEAPQPPAVPTGLDAAEAAVLSALPGGQFVVVGTHYDTKIFQNAVFVGANDGGSGTGAQLEMARSLLGKKRDLPIVLVFFDGEEAVRDWTPKDSLYGSRRLAWLMEKGGRLMSIKALLLMDMIGDARLNLLEDMSSTEWLRKLVLEEAQHLGWERFFSGGMMDIDDDHRPFLSRGVPSVAIIDFNFGPGPGDNRYWHTPEDTLDKVHPDSLMIVGRIVEATALRLGSFKAPTRPPRGLRGW